MYTIIFLYMSAKAILYDLDRYNVGKTATTKFIILVSFSLSVTARMETSA